MPKINLHRSVLIQAPVEKVFTILNDFNHWRAWSPWLILEPETKVKVADDAKYYEWEGQRVGSGNMKITSETANQSLNLDLTFLKPWKSTAKVRFELKPIEGEKTEVTWFMDTSLPFFMFWMKSMMEAWIGMDYERGLALLKDYAEDGEAHSKLGFTGVSDYPGCQYVGVKSSCTIPNLDSRMKEDFEKLWTYMGNHKDLLAGDAFSIYHKWEMVKKQVEYTAAIPVNSAPSDLPSGVFAGSMPQTSVYTVTHTGPYHHLGNAWSAMFNLERSKAFKKNKKIHPFEVYRNYPGEVPDNELIAEVKFAIK